MNLFGTMLKPWQRRQLLWILAALAIGSSWPIAAYNQPDDPNILVGLHCVNLANSLGWPDKLKAAYNQGYDIDHLPPDLSPEEKEAIINYLNGRPDISDMSFVVGSHWLTATRQQRIRFNATMLLTVIKDHNLKIAGLAGNDSENCRSKIVSSAELGEMGETKAMAFTKIKPNVNLIYTLKKQKGQRWMIDDLSVNGVSLSDKYSNLFEEIILQEGMDGLVTRMCRNLGDLKC